MAERRHHAFIGLGGNLGDPKATMREALLLLQSDTIRVEAVSSLYRTPPWGKVDQPDFLNAVASLRTALSPQSLLQACLEGERQLKRERKERWGPRLIDLDILWFDGLEVAEPELELPHPRITERAFVLVPFAELAPDLVLKGRSLRDWLSGVDRSGISVVEPDAGWALG
ncbi:MAG TPA: 2-amino-4-hydroxy-6-hydroxymethyldihydropteridine diphosphokinase [Tianweitania sediminis]|jgi:2-amino-4-hydroxy-6-hydroxymethyldihydropteridine diphosphokinase|nr:2-amino-4-hydroxy-6-hydroxymethyldihydropteridine diphosphokinase [Tianweitania sediminis]